MAKSPWRNTFFLLFIFCNFVSNAGTWLFNVGSGWLMTDLNPSGLMVSLVQTATLLPLVLLAVPGGTLGDLADRKKVLLIALLFLTAVNCVFAYLVQIDAITTWGLLIFTLLNGAGSAISGPLLTAIIPQLVHRDNLGTAMSIGGISFNAARALGPILCGYLITRFAIAYPFYINAVSFLAVVVVILFWSDDRDREEHLPARVFQLAMADSVRFVRYTPALYNSLWRSVLFFLGAGALWALLPLIAREQLGGDANTYGYLVGVIGIGAVVTGLQYDRIVAWMGGGNRLTLVASIISGAGMVAVGLAQSVYTAYAGAFLFGSVWQLAFTSLITSTQYALPPWFGGRGMAYYFMAMGLSLAVGSALWGWLADVWSLPIALFIAAGVCGVLAVWGRRYPLDQAKDADLRAFTRYPQVQLPVEDKQDLGGLVQIRNVYHPGEASAAELKRRLLKLRNKRYRSGALRWHLFESMETEEATLVEEYAEIKYTLVRRHDARITQEDQQALEAFDDWFKDAGGQCHREVLEEVK